MNRVVLITEGISGIGLGIARQFASIGDSISFHGLEPNGAEISASIGSEFGVPVCFSPENLLEQKNVETLIRTTEAELGSVSILINNAGIHHVAKIDDFPVGQWNDIVGVNLSAVFHTTVW